MKKNKIFFRADGSVITGYGHVLRALALASMLKEKYECIFVIREPDSFLKKQIEQICHAIVVIPESSGIKTELAVLKKHIGKNDMVVLDGYNFETSYQHKIKKFSFKLISIDDIFNCHYVADVVINHGEGIARNKYSIEFYTQLYLGCRYAILRKPFLKKQREKKNNTLLLKKGCRVFVNFGGTDQKNYTDKALNICLQNNHVNSIDVVIGTYYKYRERLAKLQKENPDKKINIYSELSAEAIAKLMKKSSFGICSASTVSYEYASLGGMLFLFQTVDNQKNIYDFMIKKGVAYPAKDFTKVASKTKSEKFRNDYFQNRDSYFSGNSNKNILKIFDKFELDRELLIRKAKKTDLMIYYHWANDKEVRSNSVNKTPIPLESHKAWFDAKLKSKSCFLYMFQNAKSNIGQVRIEKTKDNTAEIGFSIDKKKRGKGYSEIILRKAIFMFKSERNETTPIKAIVKTDNIPSWKAFINNGFEKDGTIEIKGESYYKFLLK